MHFKRIIIVSIFIILVIFISIGILFYINNKNENKIIEYIPQEEISEEQERNTIVTLYYISGNEIVPEARLIDVKKLLENPYKKLLELLIEGPKNDNLISLIPKETKINKIEKEGDNLIIDFSKEFINNFVAEEKNEDRVIKCIVNTVTELTEINGVKIQVEGESNISFKNGKIKFNQTFKREN